MRRLSTRSVARVLAVGALAGSASMLLLPGGTAAAATAKVAVLQQAWFWQNAWEQANPPVAQSLPATEPSGVPDGDLAVAYAGNTNKSSSKMTALSFDVSGVAPGASITGFTFSLTLDGAPTATTFDASGAAVVACLPTRSWPAQLGGDYTNQPTVDCSKKVTPVVDGSTYTFKIPAIAQTWIDDQNLGVAVMVDPDAAAAPFQLVFAGAKDVKADLTYSSGTTGSTSSSASTPVAPPAPAAGPAAPAPAPMPPASGGTTAVAPPAAAPVVAGSPAAAPATRPVAVAKTAPALPTKAFWAAVLVLAAILLAASLVLGDPQPVPASATATSRLDRVLRARASGVNPVTEI